jgi:hypothetical protein
MWCSSRDICVFAFFGIVLCGMTLTGIAVGACAVGEVTDHDTFLEEGGQWTSSYTSVTFQNNITDKISTTIPSPVDLPFISAVPRLEVEVRVAIGIFAIVVGCSGVLLLIALACMHGVEWVLTVSGNRAEDTMATLLSGNSMEMTDPYARSRKQQRHSIDGHTNDIHDLDPEVEVESDRFDGDRMCVRTGNTRAESVTGMSERSFQVSNFPATSNASGQYV